jgi:hypothetical protein
MSSSVTFQKTVNNEFGISTAALEEFVNTSIVTGAIHVTGDAVMQNVSVRDLTYGGASNISVGDDSQDLLTTGTANVAVGRGANEHLTSGINNSVLGDGAGSALTTGGSNAVLGAAAYAATAAGYESVAVGYRAMASGTDSYKSVSVGANSLRDVSNSVRCVAIGHDCLVGVSGEQYTGVVAIGQGINVTPTNWHGYLGGPNHLAWHLQGDVHGGGNIDCIGTISPGTNVVLADRSKLVFTAESYNLDDILTSLEGSAVSLQTQIVARVPLPVSADHGIALGVNAGSAMSVPTPDYADTVSIGESAFETLPTSSGGAGVAIGTRAGRYTQGAGSVLIGHEPFMNAVGGNNVGLGYQAGKSGLYSSNSVVIGGFAGLESENLQRCVALGYQALRYGVGQYTNTICLGALSGPANPASNTCYIGGPTLQNTYITGSVSSTGAATFPSVHVPTPADIVCATGSLVSAADLTTALSAKQDTITDASLSIARTSGLQTALDAKQSTITDGSLTIARTTGLQAALDAKQATITDGSLTIARTTGLQAALDAKQATITDGSLTIARTTGLQAALDAKQATITDGSLTIARTTGLQAALDAKQATITDSSLSIARTTGLQTALDAKAASTDVVLLTGAQNVAGSKVFSSPVVSQGYSELFHSINTGTNSFTCDLASGNVFYLSTGSTLSANYSVQFNNCGTLTGQSVTCTLIYATTGKWFCNSVSAYSDAGTTSITLASSTPLYNQGTPAPASSTVMCQTFTLVRLFASNYVLTSVSSFY